MRTFLDTLQSAYCKTDCLKALVDGVPGIVGIQIISLN